MTVTASGERPVSARVISGGAVIGDHAAIHYRTVVLAAGGILGPDQVSITAPVNHLPRVPAGVFAGREGRTGPPRSGPVRGRERSRHVGSARAGRCGKSELALQVSCGTSAFPSARRTGSLLLHSGARYRFTPAPCRDRPDRRRAMPQSKSAQNARIGALWTLIDVEHVRNQAVIWSRPCLCRV
jgi:hypothetical protein